jgi:hypothetical protein
VGDFNKSRCLHPSRARLRRSEDRVLAAWQGAQCGVEDTCPEREEQAVVRRQVERADRAGWSRGRGRHDGGTKCHGRRCSPVGRAPMSLDIDVTLMALEISGVASRRPELRKWFMHRG